MSTVIEWQDVPDIKPVPTGVYVATFSGVKLKEARENKGSFLNCEFTIKEVVEFTSDDDDITEETLIGLKAFNNNNLFGASLPFTKKFLLQAGLDPDFFSSPKSLEDLIEAINEDCIGKDMTISVVLEEYNGNPSPKIKRVTPAD